jgi:DNA-binding transcriptional MerR regulator
MLLHRSTDSGLAFTPTSTFRLAALEVRAAMSMRIRELAVRAGTTTRALRYYEEQGLLPASRTANGYRTYGEQHVRLVREIRTLQSIGFSLDDVRPFVDCLLAGHEAGDVCPASVDVYRRKLAYLDQRIDELAGIRDRLAARLTEVTPLPEAAPRLATPLTPDFTCRPYLEETS